MAKIKIKIKPVKVRSTVTKSGNGFKVTTATTVGGNTRTTTKHFH